MPTKSSIVVLELLEQGDKAVNELVTESGFSRTVIQENLASFAAEGRVQRTKQEGSHSSYALIPNGKPKVWDWTQMKTWTRNDGPVPGVWINHPQGHLCEWSCDWITPEGIKRPEMPDDAESNWWEARDLISRFGDVATGTDSLVVAIGAAPFPEDLSGAALSIVRHCLGVARTNLYGLQPYLHPTCIRRTGNPKFPLKLALGGLSVFTGVGFRAGWQPPGEVAKVLLKYKKVPGILGLLGKLNFEEWAAVNKMAKAFETMEATVETEASPAS